MSKWLRFGLCDRGILTGGLVPCGCRNRGLGNWFFTSASHTATCIGKPVRQYTVGCSIVSIWKISESICCCCISLQIRPYRGLVFFERSKLRCSPGQPSCLKRGRVRELVPLLDSPLRFILLGRSFNGHHRACIDGYHHAQDFSILVEWRYNSCLSQRHHVKTQEYRHIRKRTKYYRYIPCIQPFHPAWSLEGRYKLLS